MASSNHGPDDFLEKFMEVYVPYVIHLLQSKPKNARDLYRTSTIYFENKQKEREKMCNEEKEDPAFSCVQSKPSSSEESAEQKNNVCYEADFMYDSVIEIHPAKNKKDAISRDSDEDAVQQLNNFSRAVNDLKQNLAKIVGNYERKITKTGQNGNRHSENTGWSNTKSNLGTISDSTSSSDTNEGTEPGTIEQKFKSSQKDNRNQSSSHDMRPFCIKSKAMKSYVHGKIDHRYSVDSTVGHEPSSKDVGQGLGQTLSLQKAFGVDSLAEFRENGKNSQSTNSDAGEDGSKLFDSGTRVRQNHTSRLLSSLKTRNLCQRECGGAKSRPKKSPDSDEAGRDFPSLPKLNLWKLPLLNTVHKRHNKK